MVITSIAMFRIARLYWKWRPAAIGLVWGLLLAVNAAFLIASLLKFVEGGYVPLSIGAVLCLVMATWRWGRKATFAAYSAKSTMTIAELIDLHRHCKTFMERNAVVMATTLLREPTDRAPAIMQMLWERHGILPRNLILVEVTHRKVPYVRDDRYRVTVFDRDHHRGSIIAVDVSFGFMEEPNVERLLEEMHDTSRSIYRPIGGSGSCMSRRRIFCRRGVWGCSGAYGSGCSFCCASCRNRPITIMDSATKCNSPSRSSRFAFGRRVGRWTNSVAICGLARSMSLTGISAILGVACRLLPQCDRSG
jgi:K+ transporter